MVSDESWRHAARETYAVRSDDDVEIPDDAEVNVSEGGAWVEARVWVWNSEVGEPEDG